VYKGEDMSSIRDSLCGARWGYPLFNFASGEVRTCCRTSGELVTEEMLEEYGEELFLNTPYQKRRRLEMLKGIKHPSCNTCWDLEKADVYSPRKQALLLPRPWNFRYGDRDTIFLEEEDPEILYNYEEDREVDLKDINADSKILESYQPYMLEVNLSNICNMKCSYCCPRFSSRWYEDIVDLVSPDQNLDKLAKKHKRDIPGLWDEFWIWFNNVAVKSCCRVGIVGGEPLIDPKFKTFLDSLISSYTSLPLEERSHPGYRDADGGWIEDHKPVLWIVTNLNTPKKHWDLFLSYLPHLCNIFRVEIHASCESIGKKAEYVRYGLKWDRFEKNLRELCSLKLDNFTVGFQSAINSMSITSLKDFLQFAKSLHDEYEIPFILKENIVALPFQHHPLILTPDFSSYVEEAIEFLESVKDEMRWVDDEWGRWPAYITFLKGIHNGIKTNQGRDIDWDCNVRAHFFRYFSKYDEVRNTNFLETFPEYEDFYKLCEKENIKDTATW